jgi:hypothetical protein
MHEARMEVFIMPVTTQTPGEPPGHEVIYNRENREAREARDDRNARDDRVATGEHPAEGARGDQRSAAMRAGGSSAELIAGAGAAVLALLGLLGYLPLYMTSIAVIAMGCALLAHSAAVTARRTDTMRRAAGDRDHTERVERVETAGGVGSELLGGAAAIVLGILALAGAMPLVLLPVAAIVIGGTILLGAPAPPDPHHAVEGTSGGMALAGLAATVLGILALIRVGPVYTLVEVALIAAGVAVVFGSSALTARFARRLQQLS